MINAPESLYNTAQRAVRSQQRTQTSATVPLRSPSCHCRQASVCVEAACSDDVTAYSAFFKSSGSECCCCDAGFPGCRCLRCSVSENLKRKKKMNSKNGNSKPGLKIAVSKTGDDLEKLKKENAILRKKLEESSKSKLSGDERNRLLEKILDLETQNVKDSNDRARQGEVIENFSEALNDRNNGQVLLVEKEAKSLEEISTGIQKLLRPCKIRWKDWPSADVQHPPKTEDIKRAHILDAQLKDALEKNRQWLVYDQQREAYVQGLMARMVDLEQQVANAQQAEESNSEDKQKYYDRLLLAAKKDLEGERQITAQLNSELSAVRMQQEEKNKELENVSATLKALRESEKGHREEERRKFKEKMQRIKDELDLYREKYEEEKKINWDLSNQIQRCTSDLENGKIDQQNVQQQLNKVLKELRKTQEQITKLEPAKRDIYFVDSSCTFPSDFNDKLTLRDKQPSPKHKGLLDESFLECPRCRVMYPTSQHRELLAHIDFCTS
ncbi:centrosomal protein of 55 kDa isoform X2 [Dendrobates tinctorius]|uniref:centrosomal protein of 55 kDa isoform X2 n=1 Tax=Dendrobates tinctorius TaxID=92724 RepID=UPI003CC981A0